MIGQHIELLSVCKYYLTLTLYIYIYISVYNAQRPTLLANMPILYTVCVLKYISSSLLWRTHHREVRATSGSEKYHLCWRTFWAGKVRLVGTRLITGLGLGCRSHSRCKRNRENELKEANIWSLQWHTLRAFSRRFYLKPRTINIFVRRKKNNISLSVK